MPKRIQRKRTKGDRRKWLSSPARPRAECHPTKPHRARGLCDACYDRWLYANSEKSRSQKRAANNAWRARNADKVRTGQRDQKLRRKYGITSDDYDRMLQKQHGRCAICGRVEDVLHVDHDHLTDQVRALLCLPCNGQLAFVERLLRDDQWVKSAMTYLEAHHAKADTETEG